MNAIKYLSSTDIENFDRDGYILFKNGFSDSEVKAMIHAIEGGDSLEQHTRIRIDAEGKKTKLAIWHRLGDDIWAAASTSPNLVNNVRILLRQEIAFFHGKVMLKEARTGGAWEWHQDYGYWYDQGFLYPHMLSAFIALDRATKMNGCLSVLRGSHKIGRLNHVKIGSQFGVEIERIALIEPLFERVYCERNPDRSFSSIQIFCIHLAQTRATITDDHLLRPTQHLVIPRSMVYLRRQSMPPWANPTPFSRLRIVHQLFLNPRAKLLFA